MTVYASYSFYTENFNKTETALPESAFLFYAKKATQIMKQYIGLNVDESNIPEEVSMCCCEIAEYLNDFENSSATKNIRSGVSSESVGGWSVSYGTTSTDLSAQSRVAISGIIDLWLSESGLLSQQIKRGGLRC